MKKSFVERYISKLFPNKRWRVLCTPLKSPSTRALLRILSLPCTNCIHFWYHFYFSIGIKHKAKCMVLVCSKFNIFHYLLCLSLLHFWHWKTYNYCKRWSDHYLLYCRHKLRVPFGKFLQYLNCTPRQVPCPFSTIFYLFFWFYFWIL